MTTARSVSFALARALVDDAYEDACYDYVYGQSTVAPSERTDLLRRLLRLGRHTSEETQHAWYDWEVPGFLTYGGGGW